MEALTTEQQIAVLKQARLLLEAERSNNLPYTNGLCSYLRESLVALQLADMCEIHFYMLPTIFPLFTREHAFLHCNGTPEPSEFAYWWPHEDYYNRELFLNWMLNILSKIQLDNNTTTK